MTALLIILISLLGVLSILLMVKFKAVTVFEGNKFKMSVYVFGIKISDSVKTNKKEKAKNQIFNGEKKENDFKLLDFVLSNKNEILSDVKEVLGVVRRKIHTEHFEIYLRFGTGDAAKTGILCGEIWSVTGVLFPVLENSLKFVKTPEITVEPQFDKPCFEFSYKGIYSLRIYRIIPLVLKLLSKYKKYKGGVNNVNTASN